MEKRILYSEIIVDTGKIYDHSGFKIKTIEKEDIKEIIFRYGFFKKTKTQKAIDILIYIAWLAFIKYYSLPKILEYSNKAKIHSDIYNSFLLPEELVTHQIFNIIFFIFHKRISCHYKSRI
ncbi:MAG: hypothetical protein C0622_02180 [Desulfuromonas sp.]|nr:MAG: hypothetical protein C0622_02180 [Desulfuromonas sp.]